MLNLGQNRQFFYQYDLEIQWMTFMKNRAPFLYHIRLFASFQSHRWIQTWFTVQKHSIRVTIGDFLSRVTLKFEGWPWKTMCLLCCFKLCASFHSHQWIQTGVTVRKQLSWVLTSVTLTFDLWPWPFAWTSFLSMAITPENFIMIRWWEHSKKGYGQTDGKKCS